MNDGSNHSTGSKTIKLKSEPRRGYATLANRLQWLVLLLGLSLTGSFYLRKSYSKFFHYMERMVVLSNTRDANVDSESFTHSPPVFFEAPTLAEHEICGGCRLQEIKSVATPITCGLYMDQLMKKDLISITQAGSQTAKRFPRECKLCDPAACDPHQKKYWDADVAAPRVLSSRTIRLQSVPPEYRIPEADFSFLDEFFRKPKNQHPFLWEWNPTLIPLPRDQIPDRLMWNKQEDIPVYLATFRVTKQQNCFRNDFKYLNKIGNDSPLFKEGFTDLVGLAFLREDFTIIEEGLFDLRAVIKRDQDLRLFLFPPEEGSRESRIYISAFHQVSRLWLQQPAWSSGKTGFRDYFKGEDNPMVVFLESKTACCTACSGKNFNYFMDDEGKIMVETLPMAPHTVEYIDFSSDCDTSTANNAFKSMTLRDPFVPKPSFANTDELYFLDKGIFKLPHSAEHGTACCIRIPDPRNAGKELLVGVSHSKTMLSPEMREAITAEEAESRQYKSHFYAFEPVLPYRLVGFSGGFCMSNPTEEEVHENYYNNLVLERPYMMGGKKLNCPYITFLSGITDKAGDPTRAIISYGMNDCTSRFAEVSKADISNMIFDPQSRMQAGTVG